MSLHTNITHLLEATRLPVFDQHAPGQPPTPYLLVRGGAGVSRPRRLSIRSHWAAVGVSVVAVAATPDGCRHAAAHVREALTGKRPQPGQPPLQELESGPILHDGQAPADARYSITLTYRVHTPIGELP